MNMPGEIIGLIETWHHDGVENRRHNDSVNHGKVDVCRLVVVIKSQKRGKVDVCGLEHLLRVRKMIHSTCDTAHQSTARLFAVPVIQSVDHQRTCTARCVVTELMYPGNVRVDLLC